MPKNSKTPPETNASGVDLPEVERLLDFMQTHGLEEFEYERNGFRIRLRKPSAVAAPAVPLASPSQAASAETVAPVHAPAPSGPAPAAPEPPREDLHIIKSPIVGTFYSCPNPGADSFVSVGTRVEVGQVLCIIEAMKLMNEIETDAAGEIVKCLVTNGQPIEFGQPLFSIRVN